MKVPFVDLTKQHKLLKREINSGLSEVFDKSNFILGKQVSDFENQFSFYLGSKYCTGVASGSDALLLALRIMGVGPGDEVVTVANTFIATILPIIYLGAKPVLVDAAINNYQIDTDLLEKAITKKTKVIIPVHLYGIPAPMPEILKIAKKYGILVLEDACQAHGSAIKGKKCGTFGDMGAFSFYPGKNLGAVGDGGAVVTKNAKWARTLKAMRNIGQFEKYHHEIVGYNSRLDTIQAAVLSIKLKHLERWNSRRREIAGMYNARLKGISGITLPAEESGKLVNYHLYVIRTNKRDGLVEYLSKKGVVTGIHYPIPVHLQPALNFLNYKKGDFPVSEKIAAEVLSLPMFPDMTNIQVKYVVSMINNYFEK